MKQNSTTIRNPDEHEITDKNLLGCLQSSLQK